MNEDFVSAPVPVIVEEHHIHDEAPVRDEIEREVEHRTAHRALEERLTAHELDTRERLAALEAKANTPIAIVAAPVEEAPAAVEDVPAAAAEVVEAPVDEIVPPSKAEETKRPRSKKRRRAL